MNESRKSLDHTWNALTDTWAATIGRAVPHEVLSKLDALTSALSEMTTQARVSAPTADAERLRDQWKAQLPNGS